MHAKRVSMVALGVVCVWQGARAEEYPVRGRHVTAGPYCGVVKVEPEEAGLSVSHLLEFADGREVLLSGYGRAVQGGLEATLRPTVGFAGRLEESAFDPGDTLELRLRTSPDGDRWRVSLDAGGRTVGRASGARRPEIRVPLEPEPLLALEQPTPLLASDKDGSGKPAAGVSGAAGVTWFEGTAFVAAPEDGRDIHESDPRQGGLGDCYLIAALIATARNKPEAIRSMVRPQGQGQYLVTLKDVGEFWIDLYTGKEMRRKADSRQTVDQFFPTQGDMPAYAQLADKELTPDGGVRYELWPMLIEKAWAQFKGGYEQIEGGSPVTVFDFIGGTGKNTWFPSRTKGARGLKEALDKALARRQPISVGIFSSGRLAKRLGLYSHHAYVLLEARDGGYVLYNPWGSSHPSRAITAAELVQLGADIHIGGF